MESIGKLNAVIYRHQQSIINHKLKDLPIRSGQHSFLHGISCNEGITQKALSELLYVGKSTTAKAVKNLIEHGYVRKEQNEDDKRFDRLYLTEKGKEVAPRIQETFSQLLEIATKDLSVQEQEQAVYLLNHIIGNLINEKQRLNADLD